MEAIQPPIHNKSGEPAGVAGIAMDITESRKRKDQVRYVQWLESVRTLAGGIARDFNNILTAITGFGDILRRKMRENDPLRFYAEQILDASASAAQLAGGLLAFSRKQSINPKPVGLNDIIKKMENRLVSILGEDTEFISALNDENLSVLADSGQIEQVLVNLVSNAKDAMPDGGVLTISTGRTELNAGHGKKHGHGHRPPGIYGCISVSDTGKGMNKKTRERIFEPFYTTKEAGAGAGLGLAIAHGIVEQHNGYIDVRSKPGSGTTFCIHLPCIKKQVAGRKQESRERESQSHRKNRGCA